MNAMHNIKIITSIKAPIEKVFDHSRDIDLHMDSLSDTNEIAISGRTSGLIEQGETVTWRGKHFGFYLKHTSLIPEMNFPTYFVDIMTHGHFKSYRHEHYFRSEGEFTKMEDDISYETPFGWAGNLFDQLFLNKHLLRLIEQRNKTIKYRSEKD